MISALIFIGVLSALVIVHEWGHFMAARMVGIRVEKFSIGMGPVLLGKRIGDTEFCVSLLPLGGFVKLAGESPEESQGQPWEFNAKTLREKFIVVFAGPIMNALFAFVLFSFIFMVGQPTPSNVVGKVLEDSPAFHGGLAAEDRILSIDGQKTSYWPDILSAIQQGKDTLSLEVQRGEKNFFLTVLPNKKDTLSFFGKKSRLSFIGIAPSRQIEYVKSGYFQAILSGAKQVWTLTFLTLYSLILMITGTMSFKESVTGPIGIFFMTQQAAQMGLIYLLYFTASLSVSLFVLNLLPIPVLDGGHILFLVIERIKGSPLKDKLKERLSQGGLLVLLTLMVFVIFQDAHRFSLIDNVKNFAMNFISRK